MVESEFAELSSPTPHKFSAATTFWASLILKMVAIALIALGAVVLIGWHTHSTILMQIRPTYVPMAYNTALCFAATGFSLLLISCGRHLWASAFGIFVFFIGILTTLQHLSVIDLKIDDALFRAYIIKGNSHPKGMAPITAAAFSILGTALIVGSIFHGKKWATFVMGIISSVILGLGAIAILGYWTGLTGTYTWSTFTRMAVHTAFGFSAAGIGLFANAWREECLTTHRLPRWLPNTTAILVVSATLFIWHALVVKEEQELAKTVTANAATVKNEILSRLESRIRSLSRMANRWETSGKPEYKSWQADALAYVRDYPGYQGIAWVDSNLKIEWIEPLETNTIAIGKSMSGEEHRRLAFEIARNQRIARFTQPVELFQGGTGILASIPIYPNRELDGFIVGVIRLREFLDATIRPDIAPDYNLTISNHKDEVFYRRGSAEKPNVTSWIVKVPLESHGTEWMITIWPNSKLVAAHQSKNPFVVLTMGCLAAFLLAVSMYLAQNAIIRSQQAALTNIELQFEIKERHRAEAEIQKLGELQGAIVTHTAYAVISTTIDGTITTFNPAAERMLGYSADEMIGKLTPEAFHDRDEVMAMAEQLTREYGKLISPGFPVFVHRAIHDPQASHEWTYIRKDGSRFPVNLAVTALKDSSGNIVGLVGMAEDITALKLAAAELKETHRELFDASHKAGMAEVASSVLHNVGNVLNSVKISCAMVSEKVFNSKISSVTKTVELLESHKSDLGTYLTIDPQGKMLPDFLGKLSSRLITEQTEIISEIKLLDKNIDHISQIIAVQQRYANLGGVKETLQVKDLVEDALSMNALAMTRHHINVIRKYDDVPSIPVEKHKVLQILVNLIRNAKHALTDAGNIEKILTLTISMKSPTCIAIKIRDNGIGIPLENNARIFEHGFTTKKDGHGFGLHSSSLAAVELGGRLSVHSNGRGTGATFTLELPVPTDTEPSPTA